MFSSFRRFTLSKNILLLILTAGLLHGLLYYLIVPPWCHHDEPGHFEYAWLVANRPAWPKLGEFDETMRREMAKSMLKYDWYSIRNYKPNFSSSQPIWIGVPQTGGQPAYYFLISLPLRLLHNADITTQYNVARFVSLLLYLLIILAVWKAMGEIMAPGHPLQWMVTTFIVLLPAFVDTMVSINDDVAAVLASSIFVWVSLRLIKRGISAAGLAFFGLALAFCYLSKTTTWYAFLIAPLVLLISFLHGRYTRAVWITTAVGLLIGMFITIEWGVSPAFWVQDSSQTAPFRLKTSQATLGKYAFQIDYSDGKAHNQTGQFLNPSLVKPLRGKTLTLGVWVWADQPIQANAPFIRFATSDMVYVDKSYGTLALNEHPVFYRVTIDVPFNAGFASVILPSPLQTPTQAKIFFDGLVLAEGQYSSSHPQFTDAQGTQGNWEGYTFHNLIRNGSAEQGSLGIRSWGSGIANKLLMGYGSFSFIFSTLADWQGTGWYYKEALSVLFRSFWASLAADKLNVPGIINRFLVLLTSLGLLGAWHFLWRSRKTLPWDVIYILGISLALVWTFAFIRGIGSLLTPDPLYPWARYAYPVILPTVLLLCAGWLELLNLLKVKLKFTDALSNVIFLGLMLGFSAFTFMNAIQVFYPQWWTNWGPLFFIILFQAIAIRVLLKLTFR